MLLIIPTFCSLKFYTLRHRVIIIRGIIIFGCYRNQVFIGFNLSQVRLQSQYCSEVLLFLVLEDVEAESLNGRRNFM